MFARLHHLDPDRDVGGGRGQIQDDLDRWIGKQSVD
jgi:hypothetical protein